MAPFGSLLVLDLTIGNTNLLDVEQCRQGRAAGVDGDCQRRLDGEAHEGTRVLGEEVGDFMPQSLVGSKELF